METLAQYDYVLPEDRIARHPPEERDGGRLLVVGPPLSHRRITDLPELVRPGDLVVVNDTRVLPARVPARRATGGAVEVLFLGAPTRDGATVLCRPGRRLQAGETLVVGDGRVTLEQALPRGRWRVSTDPEPLTLMHAHGQVPLPPYLGRDAEAADLVRYQTVYAREPGAVAAPTAGLHLSERLITSLEDQGVRLARVTLHVGAGTFRPLAQGDLDAGRLHTEAYEVPEETVAAIRATRDRGGRVVAIGTTAARALESATAEGGDGVPCPGPSETALFIRPGYAFRCIDALVTNFHLPRSSLLVLVSAIAGRECILAAYRSAVAEGYRFYSYGDAMFLTVPR